MSAAYINQRSQLGNDLSAVILLFLSDTWQLYIFVEYKVTFQYLYSTCLWNQIRIIGVAMTSDIYHFFVVRMVKVLTTRCFEMFCLLLTIVIFLCYITLEVILPVEHCTPVPVNPSLSTCHPLALLELWESLFYALLT